MSRFLLLPAAVITTLVLQGCGGGTSIASGPQYRGTPPAGFMTTEQRRADALRRYERTEQNRTPGSGPGGSDPD